MAEWSIAAVLKTVELRGSGGSNPSLSAEKNLQGIIFQPCRFFLCPKRCTKNAPTPFISTLAGVFSPKLSTPSFLSAWQRKMRCAFFLLFLLKKMHEKGNHLCSSLLKMFFHKHSPFLISDCKIWSHCLEIFVSSVCSNHFFCPTLFRTMHNKSSSSSVCSNNVAYLGCDVVSVIPTILCFAYFLVIPNLRAIFFKHLFIF